MPFVSQNHPIASCPSRRFPIRAYPRTRTFFEPSPSAAATAEQPVYYLSVALVRGQAVRPLVLSGSAKTNKCLAGTSGEGSPWFPSKYRTRGQQQSLNLAERENGEEEKGYARPERTC